MSILSKRKPLYEISASQLTRQKKIRYRASHKYVVYDCVCIFGRLIGNIQNCVNIMANFGH